jgi:hypothetical protein
VLILLHQHQTKSKMKTTTIILAAIFTLQFQMLFAGSNNESIPANSETYSMTLAALAPVTPATANFDDASSDNIITECLAPITLLTAGFDDDVTNLLLTDLAPVIPMAADFE